MRADERVGSEGADERGGAEAAREMANGLCAVVIDSAEELAALRGEWSALWETSSASPFQTPEWLLAWWEAFHPGQLLAVAVRDGKRLAGLLPAYGDGRTVRLLGAGNTDYLDMIGDACAARAAIECLGARGCDFFDLPGSSPLLAAGADPQECQACPVIALPETPQGLEPMIAARLRKGYRQYMRRFGERGAFRFERAAAGQLSEYLDAFFGLHAARWRQSGEEGVLADGAVQRFHSLAAEGLSARGLARFYGLRDDGGALRAVQYALVRGRRMYGYLAGYDPALESFSPGTIMLRLVLEDAIRDGFREWDFLRGREPYKYDWGAHDEKTWRVRLP